MTTPNTLAAPVAAAPAPYSDATPHLHVGESSFEPWYEGYALSAPVHQSKKQQARDAYAAGMGDPLVMAAVPAMAPLTDERWLEYLLKYADASILDLAAYHGESIQDRGLWRLRGYANSLRKLVESAHGIGLTVGGIQAGGDK